LDHGVAEVLANGGHGPCLEVGDPGMVLGNRTCVVEAPESNLWSC
jgi:hypothetical protein